MRCAIYSRVSTPGQEEDGSSLDTQEAACRAFALANGYTVDEAHVYRETYSGNELYDRAKLNSLRQAVRDNAVDIVLCYAIDRLAREPVHLLIIFEEADRHKIPVEFVSEPLDDSDEGKLILYVRGFAARIEREKIRERNLRGKRARLQSGKIHGFGGELYGYLRDKEAGVRVIVEEQAVIVRRIFNHVAEGRGIRGISIQLNAEGIPSPSASNRTFKPEGGKSPRWAQSTIARIIQNPAYKGETVVWRKTHGGRGATSRPHPESEWIRLPEGVTPPIISTELWDTVQRKLETNRGEFARNAKAQNLLRGFAYCAVCGKRMYTDMEHGRRTYRCSSRNTADGACGGKRVPASAVEPWVWSKLARVLDNPSEITAEVERRRREGPDADLLAERERLTKAIATYDAQLDRLIDAFASDDGANESELRRRLKKKAAVKEQELAAARANLAKLDARLAALEATTAQLASIQTYCDHVKATLGDEDFPAKRKAVEALIDRVVINGTDQSTWWIDGIVNDAGEASHTSANCGNQPPRLRGRA